jgi:UDP-glucose 4,6-dehydratase
MNLNSNILILGDGYMGNHLYKTLSKDFEVTIKSSKDLNYHDMGTLYRYLLDSDHGAVINCSGFTGRPNIDEAESKKELCWELNVDSPLRVNRVCNILNKNYLHVSSGCIFDGYRTDWTEEDKPNYGLFCDRASFYSKSKHAFEHLSKDLHGRVLRIRMPFSPDSSSRSYLTKIGNYNNLINYTNSKTYVPDFCNFVSELLKKDTSYWFDRKTFNVVNPNPLDTKRVTEIMKEYGLHNNNWKFVPIEELDIKTSRSNCILDGSKANQIYHMKTEEQSLRETFEALTSHITHKNP